jgi:biotin-dependent carboxylase-like uncharacterized protein
MIHQLEHITILKPGLMSSIQDYGRNLYAGFGVPTSGVMDQTAYQVANHLLKNPPFASVLEMAQPGPELKFHGSAKIVFTGALADIRLNGVLIQQGKVLELSEGDVIQIGKYHAGNWLYMGISGGFDSPLIGESQSWYKGITAKERLKKGDFLSYFSAEGDVSETNAHPRISVDHYAEQEIPVFRGPEWNKLSAQLQDLILNRKFTLSRLITRMAYQLDGFISNNLPSILTAPVYPGTVQLAPSGKLLVLMRDAQLTGGYPRILQLDEKAISSFSQQSPGSNLIFKLLE